jgi:hypothetical protein
MQQSRSDRRNSVVSFWLNENNDEANIISKNGRMAFFIIWFFIFLLHKDTIIFQIFSCTFPEKLSNKNDNKK